VVLYLVYFAVFAAAILFFEAVVLVAGARRRRRQAINRRLRKLQDLPDHSSALSILLDERGIGSDSDRNSPISRMKQLWIQSGMTVRPHTLFVVTTGVAALLATAVLAVWSSLAAMAGAFFLGAVGIPLYILLRRKKKRILKFTNQLPNALDVIVRSLRAGHPVPTAIGLVARETPDPVGTEFGIVFDELTYGLQVDEAMAHLSERVGAEELKLLATTISVQRSTGGNLAEILENLSTVIRERIQMRARIRALSAEGRFTAWLMAAFPFLIYLALSSVSPNYFDTFWQSPFVTPVIITCVVLMLVGNYILFKMVNFDF
jgi:tight adherence protein B